MVNAKLQLCSLANRTLTALLFLPSLEVTRIDSILFNPRLVADFVTIFSFPFPPLFQECFSIRQIASATIRFTTAFTLILVSVRIPFTQVKLGNGLSSKTAVTLFVSHPLFHLFPTAEGR